MHCNRKLIITTSVFVLLCGLIFTGEAQEGQTRLAQSSGNGTLRVGDEQFKINTVIVKLLPDHTAEITIVSDITIFLTATWSNHTDSPDQFNLEFAAGSSRGGLEGTGQMFLRDDGKTLKRLTLKGVSRATKRAVEADFEGK